MHDKRPPALSVEQYAKGAVAAAAYEIGGALLLHLAGLAWTAALLGGTGISILLVLGVAVARGPARRRALRREQDDADWPSTRERARWASEALAAYARRAAPGTPSPVEDPDELDWLIRDLITDLCHFAEPWAAPEPLAERAVGRYQEEARAAAKPRRPAGQMPRRHGQPADSPSECRRRQN